MYILLLLKNNYLKLILTNQTNTLNVQSLKNCDKNRLIKDFIILRIKT